MTCCGCARSITTRCTSSFERLNGSIRNENQEPTLRRVTLNLIRKVRGAAHDLERFRVAIVGSDPILVGSQVRVAGLDAEWYVIGRREKVPPGTEVLDLESKLAKACSTSGLRRL